MDPFLPILTFSLTRMALTTKLIMACLFCQLQQICLGESREPFLVINKYVRQEPELLLNIPPTEETRVRAFQTSIFQYSRCGNSNGIIAPVYVCV